MRPHASPGPDTWATPADGHTYFVRILGDPVPVWLHWLESRRRRTRGERRAGMARPRRHPQARREGQQPRFGDSRRAAGRRAYPRSLRRATNTSERLEGQATVNATTPRRRRPDHPAVQVESPIGCRKSFTRVESISHSHKVQPADTRSRSKYSDCIR